MKKYILTFIILLLAGVNTAWGQPHVAQIDDGSQYETLQAAIDAVPTSGIATITLLGDVTDGSAFQIRDSRKNETLNITIDFAGHTYTVINNTVGSSGTTNQAMHFAGVNNNLILKSSAGRATITTADNVDGLKIMMQNYCNLTIDNVNINASHIPTQVYEGSTYGEWEGITRPVFNFNSGISSITNSTITFSNTDVHGLIADENGNDGQGSVTLGNGTTVNGNVTVEAGKATINGATITGNAKSIQIVPSQTIEGELTISSGTFQGNVVQEYGTVSVSGGSFPNAVAKTGDNQYFTTLAEAFAAVPTDGTATTVTLLKDITLTDNVIVGGTYGSSPKTTTAVTNQNVILNLNNYNITGTKTLYLAGGSLNIIGTGTIESTSPDVAPVGVRYVKTTEYPNLDYTSKRTLTIGENVTLKGAEYGLNIFGTNESTTVNKIDVNINGVVEGMLFVLGNLKNVGNEININVNGAVDASGVTGNNEKVHSGIALCGNANVTVADGATVEGESGIEVRAGNLTVNGGTITATSADYSYTANGNGTTTKGAAIAVAQHSTALPINVALNGGTLSGTKKIAVNDVNGNELNEISVIVSNSFLTNSDTESEIPAVFIWVDNGNNTKKLVLAPVRVGDVGYATLAEALDAVQTDETVKLYDDVLLIDDIACTLPDGSTFTVDFNNHNVIRNDNHVVLPVGVSVLTNVAVSQLFAAAEGYVVVQSNTDNQDYPYEYSVRKSINNATITVTVDPATYTGAVQTPVVTVTDGSTTLGTDDYDITYKGSTLQDAKTYVDEIIITGKGNYSGTRYANFTIQPKGVTGLTATAIAPYVSGGYADAAAVKAAWTVVVKDGANVISSDLYNVTLAAGEYLNAGVYSDVVTITFKEGQNYAGTIITDLDMTQGVIDIASALVTSTAVYNGTTQAPSSTNFVVKVGDMTLTYNTDFTFEYNGKNTDYEYAKIYSDAILISGKGRYYGTTTADYVILPCPVSQTTITVNNIEYSASALDTKSHVSIKIGEKTISPLNYTVTPASVTEAGTYTLTITGIENSNLIGSTTAILKVTKALTDQDYSDDFTFTEIPTQIYDGENPVQPTISVYDNGRLLTKDEEYTIAYEENNSEGVDAGTITITGAGAYHESIDIHFAIVNEYFTEDDIVYHAMSSTTVAVGNKGVAATTLKGAINIPATVEHVEITTPFRVIGIEKGAFKNCTGITGIDMPHSTLYLENIENGAFEGCTNLRYIDLCNAISFIPSSLQRNIEASPFYGLPKQALVYLNGTTFKGENYVYKPGDGTQYYCELFKIYDDMAGDQQHFAESYDYKWAFENRHSFTAYNVENTRMLTADNHYTTCLPYDLSIPTGMKAYTLEATSDKLFGFKEVTGTLDKFTPYVLIPTTSGQLLSTTNAVIQELKEENSATTNPMKLGANTSASTANQFTMGGTMRYIDGPDAANFYIMQGKDANGVCTWKKIVSAASNTGEIPENPCILPMRAYIKSGDALSRELMGSSFCNGISDHNVTTRDTIYYDLIGRQVQTPKPGRIYIKNGKKVMINKY